MVKSPTPRSRRHDCSFTKEEEIWIIKHSGGRGATELRRLFIRSHNLSNHHAVPHKSSFERLVQRFNATGGVTGTNRGKTPFAVTPENIARVEAFFEENPTKSIAMAVRELDISFGSIWFILRRHLKWRPYKYKRVNKLTPANEEARREFCRWILAKEVNFEQKIIFSDEKMFQLHPSPHRQNDHIWAPFDPDEEAICKVQGAKKVMCWAALVGDSVLTLRWMDEEHRPRTMTGESYGEMLRNEVWPEVRGRAGQRRWWWQQDGAALHCTEENLAFLVAKFRGRVISRRGENPWPPYSPDLSPLDYYFWGYANAEVFRQQPTTIPQLKAIVEEVAANLSGDVLRAVMANFRKRCEVCLEFDGGHFEYALERF